MGLRVDRNSESMNLQNQPNIWELGEWHQIKLNTPLLGSIFSFGSMGLRKVVENGERTDREEQGERSDSWV